MSDTLTREDLARLRELRDDYYESRDKGRCVWTFREALLQHAPALITAAEALQELREKWRVANYPSCDCRGEEECAACDSCRNVSAFEEAEIRILNVDPPTPDAPATDATCDDDGITRAPWTREQVSSLNDFQTECLWHPFTCGTDNCGADLVATVRGWICPLCDYTQNWAHSWMADRGWEAQRRSDLVTAPAACPVCHRTPCGHWDAFRREHLATDAQFIDMDETGEEAGP